jgi:hypothetical protein
MFIYHFDHKGGPLNKQVDWRACLEWGRRYRALMSEAAFCRTARHHDGMAGQAPGGG